MSSLHQTLDVIRRLLNEYLQNLNRRGDDWVVLTSMVDHDGTLNEAARDKVVMCLYNITREHTISTYSPAKAGGGAFAIVPPPIYINLHLIFMANFAAQGYGEGLAAIASVIGFFQQTPWLSQANAPDLPPDLDKITLELSSLGPVDVNYVMGMLGTKYLPSVFYKLRMLPFAASTVQARTYPVAGGAVNELPRKQAP